MKTSHTPGPWRADRNAEGDWETHATTEQSEFSFWIATVHAETKPEQTQANARLIATAPELLEALQEVLNPAVAALRALDRYPEPVETDPLFSALESVRAAIAKATQP